MGESSGERLGIAGSGAIACGLARTAAQRLPAVGAVVWARSEESAARAAKRAGGHVEVTTDFEALAGCSVVVEAVAEDVVVKSDLLARLGALLPEDALLASTTSSLSVAELARASARPDRFGALHVFNPVDKMKLIELAFPAEASELTRARLRSLCDALGKTAVEVPDSPGFVVNRLLFPYLFDAVRLMEAQGLEPAAVDACMKLGAGHPMGPLALLDFVGLDVATAIGDSIGVEVPARVREMAASGRLGRKSGAGFFNYDR
ncbi:MAG TPA: 3-hydroxyacyl-CoA dehydrogenase NAD-binding domain-containing protein [Thermoleophilaceae bacterium]|nr:3-hydroxyacyl-CoA dehydrogenase NAD-binding domain-containing protein [Thermoleophilaceae bacterium]